jgi:hypothetical protein
VTVRACVWLLLVGCYQPSPPANAPCAPNGACPSGQSCESGLCVTGGTLPFDAAIDARLVDAPRADASVDAPNTSGCSDGAREGFFDENAFPTIAACAASWAGSPSLRATATGTACGDDLATDCGAPADACAAGWHVCGTAGDPTELSGRASQAECASAGGADATSKFVIAMSHCTTICTYDTPYGCEAMNVCSEPVCCGGGCRSDQGCLAAVYPTTAITSDTSNGCGMMPASLVTGVLCCK